MLLEEFKNKAIESVLRETSSVPAELHEGNVLNSKLSKLNVESLSFMEIVMELEDMIEVQVDDEHLSGDPTLEDFLNKIYESKA